MQKRPIAVLKDGINVQSFDRESNFCERLQR